MNTAPSDRRLGAAPEPRPAPYEHPRDDWTADQWRRYVVRLQFKYNAEIKRLQDELGEIRMTLLKADQEARHQRDEDFRALTLYGGERTLETIKQQVALSPKFVGLSPLHCEYVARVALATGLHPEFHIHAWISKKYNPQTRQKEDVLNVTPDYKGLLSLVARDRYHIKQRPLTPDELRARGVPEREITDGALGYVVEAWDLAMKIRCDQAGVEYEPTRGYGWWAALKDEERWDDTQRKYVPTGVRVPNDVSNTRDGAFEAWRRATRALCYQIADLSLKFGGGVQVPGARVAGEDTYVFDADAEPEPEQITAASVIDGDWEAFDTPAVEQAPAPQAAGRDATDDEIREIVRQYCVAHPGTTVKAARDLLAQRLGVASLARWSGPAGALQAAAEQ